MSSPMTDKAKGGRNAIVIVILALVVFAAVTFWRRSQRAEVTYKEIEIQRGDIEVSILATGVVQPENRLEIKPPIAGRAEQVLVDEGYSIKKGEVLVWMSSTERAALLDAARARGPKELARWEEYYKATPVLAPINGTLIQRNIQPGQTFTTADAILVMSDRLTIQAQVDETDIAQVQLKQKANLILDAYPKFSFAAHVDKIAYDAKTVNNVTTYIVDVLPEETPSFMRSGMTANVSFLVNSKKNALIAPSEAIKKSPDGSSYVLSKSPEGSAKPVERGVRTGLSDGKRVEIVSGLSEKDVILLPQLKVGGKTPSGSSPFSPMGTQRRH